MTHDDWIENRIVWKAQQRGLLASKYCREIDVTNGAMTQAICAGCKLAGRPILFFSSNFELTSAPWTVLTTREIVSEVGGDRSLVRLNDIRGQIEPCVHGHDNSTEPQVQDVKHDAACLCVGEKGHPVWIPKGNELTALWAILNMFPISPRK